MYMCFSMTGRFTIGEHITILPVWCVYRVNASICYSHTHTHTHAPYTPSTPAIYTQLRIWNVQNGPFSLFSLSSPFFTMRFTPQRINNEMTAVHMWSHDTGFKCFDDEDDVMCCIESKQSGLCVERKRVLLAIYFWGSRVRWEAIGMHVKDFNSNS